MKIAEKKNSELVSEVESLRKINNDQSRRIEEIALEKNLAGQLRDLHSKIRKVRDETKEVTYKLKVKTEERKLN